MRHILKRGLPAGRSEPSLKEAADALGITKQTARTQLKAVFAKAGTHRQSELVALLARLARARPEISSV